MAKRKRNPEELGTSAVEEPPRKQQQHLNGSANGTNNNDNSIAVQIVTGSYDRTLHGVVASIPQIALRQSTADSQVTFNDTFLIEAHASAVRCLALSPPSDSPDPRQQKVILASGSTDERISLYSLSTCRPAPGARPNLLSAVEGAAIENPKNREMGSLLHHAASVNALYFPTKSKLLSGADDNTIAVSRTRDWTVLSTIKAPLPKIAGRPSGDTAGPGDVPTGINDFAVHPSMKVMVSVSKGERCMRLWNLVTGKKAGVLTFERPLLQQVGEGKHSRGEGLKIKWNAAGEDFVVGFERGAAIFGMDSKPRAVIVPTPRTKIHQMRYLPGDHLKNIIAISTEDGRILFYDTAVRTADIAESDVITKYRELNSAMPKCDLFGHLGEENPGMRTRIKDFEVLELATDGEKGAETNLLITTASSDGVVNLWLVQSNELLHQLKGESVNIAAVEGEDGDKTSQESTRPRHVGRLLGQYDTGSRVTCLAAFVMSRTTQPAITVPSLENGHTAESDESD